MLRTLVRSPGFTAAAVGILAVAIGATVALFSVYQRVVAQPVSIRNAETVVAVFGRNLRIGPEPRSLSWPRFESIRESARSLTQVAAYSQESLGLVSDDGAPEEVRTLRVSQQFFEVLRLSPAHGRVFSEEEDQLNGPSVCVLTHEYWRSRFGGDDVIGKVIVLGGASTEIVGVLPPRLTPPWSDAQVLIPRVFDDTGFPIETIRNGASYLSIVGRRAPNTPLSQVAEDMRRVSSEYSTQFAGRGDASTALEVQTFGEFVAGTRGRIFGVLFAAVAGLLAIAGANVSALFLGRLVTRQREFAVRQALGASAATIVRQCLAESTAIAASAGILGVLVAGAMLAGVRATLGSQLPPGADLSIHPGALAIALGAVVVCSLLVGLAPALYAIRSTRNTPLLSSARGMSETRGARRLHSVLVIGEVAAAVVLLAGSASLAVSLVRLQSASPGFNPSGVASAYTNLVGERYAVAAQQGDFASQLLERLRGTPGVTAAAIAFGLPFGDWNSATTYSVDGRPIVPPADRPRAGVRIVSEDYFRLMQMSLKTGRTFGPSDRIDAPFVCVINESLARRLFGDSSAIGRGILRGRDANIRHEIIGVVGDVRTNGLRNPAPDEIFFSTTQVPRAHVAILVRTAGDPAAMRSVIQSAVVSVDPTQPIADFATMDQRFARTLGEDRTITALTTAFAIGAVVLAVIGIYAVLVQDVTRRMTEFGIRLALGAQRGTIARLVLTHGARVVFLGTALGLVTAAGVAGVLASHLYEVDARDPLVYAVVAALFGLVSLAAALAPSLRAGRTDPMETLRRA